MTTLHPCRPVGLDFLGAAPAVFSNAVGIALTPEQLRRTTYRIGAVGARLLGTVLVGRGREWRRPRPRSRAAAPAADWAGLETGDAR